MVKKKGKSGGKRKGMDTGDDTEFSYGTATASGPKKKKIVKLSRKQKLRKELRIAKGEALVDRRHKKAKTDQRRLDKRLAAKALW